MSAGLDIETCLQDERRQESTDVTKHKVATRQGIFEYLTLYSELHNVLVMQLGLIITAVGAAGDCASEGYAL